MWMEKNQHKRRIRKDRVNGLLISTAFIGCDVIYGGKELFETMVFDSDHKNGQVVGRYGSHKDALEGHRQCKQAIKSRALSGTA